MPHARAHRTTHETGRPSMKRILIAVGAGALTIGLAACGSHADAATAPSFQLTADDSLQVVVNSAGSTTVGDLDVLNSSASTLSFDLQPSFALSASVIGAPLASYAAASGCTLNTATSIFVCPPTTVNGLTLIRTFEFFNAAGTPVLKFNDSTTASVNLVATEGGVRPSATGADTISRLRTLTASGLLGHNTTRIWNGTGFRTDGGYWTDSVAARTYDVTDNTTFTSIVVTLPRTANPYPTSGSITRQVAGAGTVTKGGVTKSITISRTVTITFNGTEFVPMTIGSTSYTLDLATGKATKN